MTITLPELVTPTGVLILPADASREEWLKARRSGIGGSDALGVLGLSQYSSRYTVWADKSGLLRETDDSEVMRWGRLLEPVIAAEFQERTGIEATTCGLMRHVERSWQLASVDRLTADGGVLEIKTTSAYKAGDWDDDQLADAAEAQLQHYLAVTGLEHGYAAALIGGQRLEIRHVERNDRLISLMVEAQADLWQMVQDGTPPALDGTDATARAIAELCPYAIDLPAELPAAMVTRLRADQGWAEEIKILEQQRKAVKNEITALLGDLNVGTYQGQDVVTWKNTGKFAADKFTSDHPDLAEQFTAPVPQLDEKALKAAHPDLYARYRSRVFRPIKKGLQ
ncbi:YqaJ viral recombinase family protein [Streptosporangium sp. NBC_01755]|uniref:YqaJ viral recombinase family nuclease n=1 Tax=Streptosporangium sp. NBC_01755 TaxID=2975949 RepID=UPI002DDAB856|nr:YqaJ viral recombinase family protein [Streptosporangium sp. NBC_01755]WSD03284.1 YqaJ viral recombinase family protein [Streptosporangium sp. NBC_01755]